MTFNSTNCLHKLHAKYEKDDFDVQVSINDCTVNEFIFTLYHTGLLKLPVQSKKLLTTDTLSHLVGNDLIDKFGGVALQTKCYNKQYKCYITFKYRIREFTSQMRMIFFLVNK